MIQFAHDAEARALPGPKAPRPRGARAAKARPAPRQKVSLNLLAEAIQRLEVHAAMTGIDRNVLVERLILDGLRRFRVADHGDRPEIPVEGISAN